MENKIDVIKVFETFVLRFISLQCILLTIYYFSTKQYVVGILLLVPIFFLGIIGQGMKHNKNKTFTELTQGQDFDFRSSTNAESPSKESMQVARALLYVKWMLAFTTAFLLFYHNVKWYITIPVSLMLGMILPTLYLTLGILITRATTKTL